jgi:hypothetical protein
MKSSKGNNKKEKGDDDGKKHATKTTTTSTTKPLTSSSTSTIPATSPSSKTTPTPPPPTYVENLTCCVCMDELPVDCNAFVRLACCGQGMDKECWTKFRNSTMPRAQKSVCPQCRQKFPTSAEGTVKQIREWVDKGKVWAQTNLANKYHFGLGVPQSYEEAIRYLNMAVKQGDPNAMYSLATMYREGEGVAKSLGKTAELSALAANQGHAGAQACLGVFYYHGNGVAQSNDMSRKWWLEAALQGHEDSIKHLKIIDQQEGKTTPTLPCCAACGTHKTTRRPLKNCTRCRTTQYCNRECQMTHWKAGHKRKCNQLQKQHQKRLAAASESEEK